MLDLKLRYKELQEKNAEVMTLNQLDDPAASADKTT